MAQAITDPLASLLNTQGQLQIAKYGRPGVGGNLSGTLGYLADFIKGVYSMPEGSPGIFGGIAEVLNRYNVRQYADQQFQAQQEQLARQQYEQQMQRQQMGKVTGVEGGLDYRTPEMINAARPYEENMATNESLNDYSNNGVYNARPMAKPETMGPIAKDFMTRQQQIADANATLKGVQGAYQAGSQGQNPYGTPVAQPTKNMPLQNMDPNIGPLQGGVNAQSAPSILGGVVDIAQLLLGGKQGTEQYNSNRTYGLDQSKLQELKRANIAGEGIQGMNAQTSRMNAIQQAISDKVNAGLRAKEIKVSAENKNMTKLATQRAAIEKQLKQRQVINKDGIVTDEVIQSLKSQNTGDGNFIGLGGLSAQDAAKRQQNARLLLEYNTISLQQQGVSPTRARMEAIKQAQKEGWYGIGIKTGGGG